MFEPVYIVNNNKLMISREHIERLESSESYGGLI